MQNTKGSQITYDADNIEHDEEEIIAIEEDNNLMEVSHKIGTRSRVKKVKSVHKIKIFSKKQVKFTLHILKEKSPRNYADIKNHPEAAQSFESHKKEVQSLEILGELKVANKPQNKNKKSR